MAYMDITRENVREGKEMSGFGRITAPQTKKNGRARRNERFLRMKKLDKMELLIGFA
jgi:hypothetical protein